MSRSRRTTRLDGALRRIVVGQKHISELIATRRAFLGGVAALPLLQLGGCATATSSAPSGAAGRPAFAPVAATNADTITLPPGYSWRKLIAWGDALFDTVSADFDPDRLTQRVHRFRGTARFAPGRWPGS